MDNNEILARWQGWTKYGEYWLTPDKTIYSDYPDYPTDSTACMSLLDTLVERGYDPALIYYRGTSAWYMQIFDGEVNAMYPQKPTHREAIIAACLEVTRKEAQGE